MINNTIIGAIVLPNQFDTALPKINQLYTNTTSADIVLTSGQTLTTGSQYRYDGTKFVVSTGKIAGLIAVKNISAGDSSPIWDIERAEVVFGNDTTNTLYNVVGNTQIQAYLQAKVVGASGSGGAEITMANGKYFGFAVSLVGNSTTGKNGALTIRGKGDVKLGSASSGNGAVFKLSKSFVFNFENLEFNLQNNYNAVRVSVAPNFYRGIFAPTITSGVITNITITQPSIGQLSIADLVAVCPDGTGQGFTATLTAGGVVNITAQGTGYSANTVIYQVNGYGTVSAQDLAPGQFCAFKNIRIFGNTVGHTGYALELGNPFKTSFDNVEIRDTRHGIKFEAETQGFNPGNCTLNRVMFQNGNTIASTPNTVAYHFRNYGTPVLGRASMNLVNMTGCDAISINGGMGILVDGTTGVSGIKLQGGNFEQFDTIVDLQSGIGNTFALDYCVTKPGGTHFKFGKRAVSNQVIRHQMALNGYTGTPNVTLIKDDGSITSAKNIIRNVTIQSSAATSANILIAGAGIGKTIFERNDIVIVNADGTPNITSIANFKANLPLVLQNSIDDVALTSNFLVKQVRLVSMTNIGQLTGLTALPTIDGEVLAVNQAVLLLAQTTATQNGRYILTQNGANFDYIRATDTIIGEEVKVLAGTIRGGAKFYNTNTNTSFAIGTTAMAYSEVSRNTQNITRIIGQSISFLVDTLNTASSALTMQWQDNLGIFMQVVNRGRIRMLRNIAYTSRFVTTASSNVTNADINLHVDLRALSPVGNIGSTINLPLPEFCENGAEISVGDFYRLSSTSNRIRIQSSATPMIAGSTISTTLNSAVVTGVNTQFTKEANFGMILTIEGMDYSVLSIQSDTSLTLSVVAVATSTGVTYTRFNPVEGAKFYDINMPGMYTRLTQPTISSAGQGWKII